MYQLGALIVKYRKSLGESLSYIIFGVIVFGAGLFFIDIIFRYFIISPSGTAQTTNDWIGAAIGFAVLIITPLVFGPFLIYKGLARKELLFYTKGFLSVQGSKMTAVRYDSIPSVWQKITHNRISISFIPVCWWTIYLYTVQTPEGKKFQFNKKEQGERILQEVFRYKMPRAIATYSEGGDIIFGPITVSNKGLTRGKKTLSWSEIKAVNINNGVLYVEKRGGWFSWTSVAVARIPNFYVFLALVDQICGINRR
jgi:hypothetical protein